MFLHKIISVLGGKFVEYVLAVARAWMFIFEVFYKAITPPYRFKLIVQQLNTIGAQSVLVVALVGFFTGAVLAVQGEYTLAKFGATAYVGGMTALALIRELGPVLTALMVNGRAGSAMTAELGIMKISEQVDALRSMAVDPVRYLMVPRVIACLISVPLLTMIFNTIGIFGGYLVGVENLGLSSGSFWARIISSVGTMDVWSSLIKSLCFGLIIAWVACYKGWTCGFGAVGVNKATTSSVVTASVAILVMDYFLTSILNVMVF